MAEAVGTAFEDLEEVAHPGIQFGAGGFAFAHFFHTPGEGAGEGFVNVERRTSNVERRTSNAER